MRLGLSTSYDVSLVNRLETSAITRTLSGFLMRIQSDSEIV